MGYILTDEPLIVAKRVFETLCLEFPSLESALKKHDFLDLLLEFPKQEGLDFEVSMNLQNHDELHLNVDELWASWFPCTDPEVEKAFLDAVTGLIDGKNRIKVFLKKGAPYRRLLQRPESDGWKTIYTHSSLHWPFFFKPEIRYVQNEPTT